MAHSLPCQCPRHMAIEMLHHTKAAHRSVPPDAHDCATQRCIMSVARPRLYTACSTQHDLVEMLVAFEPVFPVSTADCRGQPSQLP